MFIRLFSTHLKNSHFSFLRCAQTCVFDQEGPLLITLKCIECIQAFVCVSLLVFRAFRARGTCEASVYLNRLAGDHICITLHCLHLSANLIITIAAPDIYCAATCKAFMSSLLYSKALHARVIESQRVVQCSPDVVFSTFQFLFYSEPCHRFRCVCQKLLWGYVLVKSVEKLHRGIWTATCAGSNRLHTVLGSWYWLTVSFESSESHKTALKWQPWHYQVQIKADIIEPWRWIPQKGAGFVIYWTSLFKCWFDLSI